MMKFDPEMKGVWKITGRCIADPPPESWALDLTTRLGQRPRRLGAWAELALYGARMCLDSAAESSLPHDAVLRVSSTLGTATAFMKALEQSQEGFLLPFSFLQSQSSQMLAAVANQFGWQGDATYVTATDAVAVAQLVCIESGPNGVLVGWVNDSPKLQSIWLRLVPVQQPAIQFKPATAALISDMSVQYWQLAAEGLMVA